MQAKFDLIMNIILFLAIVGFLAFNFREFFLGGAPKKSKSKSQEKKTSSSKDTSSKNLDAESIKSSSNNKDKDKNKNNEKNATPQKPDSEEA